MVVRHGRDRKLVTASIEPMCQRGFFGSVDDCHHRLARRDCDLIVDADWWFWPVLADPS
jgi:hypothetical protein